MAWSERLHPVVLGAIIWILLSSLATVFMWATDGSDRTLGRELHDHGVAITATVTGTDPSDHNSVAYSYVADGRTFHEGYFGDGPQGAASHLHVGQPISVVYDSQAPSISCYCDVNDLTKSSSWLRNAFAGLILTSVVSVVATLWLLKRRGTGPTLVAEPTRRV